MKKILDRVNSYMEEFAMTAPGQLVCVALSGGADSVCLLDLLNCLKERRGIRLCAVHIDHRLRGEESDADRDFVRDLCRKWDVPLTVRSASVADLALEQKKSLEEMGREVRQQVFRELVESRGVDRIALAHHRGDQAETLLFRAARGTSLRGMMGILPVHDWRIRPLLDISREEIEAYLLERGQAWRTDRTNLENDFARNAIRNLLLPHLEREINSAAVRHLAELAADTREAWEVLSGLTEKACLTYLIREGSGILVREEVRQEKSYLVRSVLERALAEGCGSGVDLGREQVRQLKDLLEGSPGRRADLPYRLTARRDREGVRIYRRPEKRGAAGSRPGEGSGGSSEEDAAGVILDREALEAGEILTVRLPVASLLCRLVCFPEGVNEREIPKSPYTKWFDYDRIDDILTLRHRQAGDRIQVFREGGSRKLKALLIDEKIPRQERDRLFLLASGSEILWVIGCRMGWGASVTGATRRVLSIELISPRPDMFPGSGRSKGRLTERSV